MTTLGYRGADGGATLSYREHFRQHWPHPSARPGCVVEDCDVFLRVFSADNPKGCFALIEFKYENGTVSTGQDRAYQQMHKLMRRADPEELEYRGAFVVRYTHDDAGIFVPLSARPFGSKMVRRFESTKDFDLHFKHLLNPDCSPSTARTVAS